jgi:hypothetical protein
MSPAPLAGRGRRVTIARVSAPAGPGDPLRDVAPFAALPEAARAELAAGAAPRTLPAGTWLFQAGERL